MAVYKLQHSTPDRLVQLPASEQRLWRIIEYAKERKLNVELRTIHEPLIMPPWDSHSLEWRTFIPFIAASIEIGNKDWVTLPVYDTAAAAIDALFDLVEADIFT